MEKVLRDWPYKIIMYDKKWSLIFAIVQCPWQDEFIIRFREKNLQKIIDHIDDRYYKRAKYYWRDEEKVKFMLDWPLKQWCKYNKSSLFLR